jgi:hypothetical protein
MTSPSHALRERYLSDPGCIRSAMQDMFNECETWEAFFERALPTLDRAFEDGLIDEVQTAWLDQVMSRLASTSEQEKKEEFAKFRTLVEEAADEELLGLMVRTLTKMEPKQ